MYLGGNISENGRVDVDVRRRIQAGANAWRNVEGVMVDRKISRKLKEKVPDSCVVPASVCVSFIRTTMKVQLDTEISIQIIRRRKWSN